MKVFIATCPFCKEIPRFVINKIDPKKILPRYRWHSECCRKVIAAGENRRAAINNFNDYVRQIEKTLNEASPEMEIK